MKDTHATNSRVLNMLKTYDILKKPSNSNFTNKNLIHKFKASSNNLLLEINNSTFHSPKRIDKNTSFQSFGTNIEEGKFSLHTRVSLIFGIFKNLFFLFYLHMNF